MCLQTYQSLANFFFLPSQYSNLHLLTSSNRVCQAVLQGHTWLVGNIQLRGNTLVSGGYDGIMCIWSLYHMTAIHRIAVGNSITSLRCDHNRIITGSSKGRVQVWDLATGILIRELGNPSIAVWRVRLSESMAVVIRSEEDRVLLDVSYLFLSFGATRLMCK